MFKMSQEKKKKMLEQLDEEARNEGEVQGILDLEDEETKSVSPACNPS